MTGLGFLGNWNLGHQVRIEAIVPVVQLECKDEHTRAVDASLFGRCAFDAAGVQLSILRAVR